MSSASRPVFDSEDGHYPFASSALDDFGVEAKIEFDNLTLMQEKDRGHYKAEPLMLHSTSSPQSQRNIRTTLGIDLLDSNDFCPDLLPPQGGQLFSDDRISHQNLSLDWEIGLSIASGDDQCEEVAVVRQSYQSLSKSNNGLSSLKLGVRRRQGAGRKTVNPEMERLVIEWVFREIDRQKAMPKRRDIINIAKQYVSDKFKASKGWCDKFLKRNASEFERRLRKVGAEPIVKTER